MTSRKDQAQYWADPSRPYTYIPVSEIAKAFHNSRFGNYVESTLATPFDKSKNHPSALAKTEYAVSTSELFKTCFAREILLIKRHSFLYIFRTCQVSSASVTCFCSLKLKFLCTFIVYKSRCLAFAYYQLCTHCPFIFHNLRYVIFLGCICRFRRQYNVSTNKTTPQRRSEWRPLSFCHLFCIGPHDVQWFL